MSDQTYAQACLTPRLGGLGLAWLIMQAGMKRKKLREKCGCRLLVCLRSICLKKTSFEFDEKMHAYFVDNSNARGAQRLRRAAQPRACGFITAVP